MDKVQEKANEKRLQKLKQKEEVALRLKKGKMTKFNDVDSVIVNSPPQLPFFSKVDNHPSKVEAHLLTPPKRRSKDGVVGFDMEGNYYKTNVPSTTNFNPFEKYIHQNMGVLRSFINMCAIHYEQCIGKLHFIGEDKSVRMKPFMGSLFAGHNMQCSICGAVLLLETDLFQQRPNIEVKDTCISWASQLTVVASKNMSWVYEE